MLVYKCDICESELDKNKEGIIVGNRGIFSHFSLCDKCGKPIIEFMKKNKLIEIKKNKKLLA